MAQKLFIFAIGGTGERVLRSFTMLMAAGVEALHNYEVYPIILDYDKDNGDKARTVGLLQNYAAVHSAAFGKHGEIGGDPNAAGTFFASKLVAMQGLQDYVWPFQPPKDQTQFCQYIGKYSLTGPELMKTEELLHTLYDESAGNDTELNLDMTVGFKGNPNIGSVVFHELRDAKQFTTFRGIYQPGSGDLVVVIGSLFGGTGASGIPEIVAAIDSLHLNGTKIAIVPVLPYFSPMDSPGGTIQARRFNAKTKAALKYYQESGILDMVKKAYYVGYSNPTLVPYCEGASEQLNNANIVELAAAAMIADFANSDGGVSNQTADKDYKFAIDQEQAQGGQRLYYEHFDTDFTQPLILQPLLRLAIGLKFFTDELYSKALRTRDYFKLLELERSMGFNTPSTANAPDRVRDLGAALVNFNDRFRPWLEELDTQASQSTASTQQAGNALRLALCDFGRLHSYERILCREPKAATEETKGLLDRLRNNKGGKPLDADYLSTRMDYHFNQQEDGSGHYDRKLKAFKPNHQREWAFIDILSKAAKDGLEERTLKQ